jgi:hypothetical protein
MIGVLLLFGFFFVFLLVSILFFVSWVSWNIPVTILRYTGGKERPMLLHKKAKKRIIKGVPYLWVRGYKMPVRDFKAEHYYPAFKAKWGGLILWEFEDGWLTPVGPRKQGLTKDEEALVRTALSTMNDVRPVKFEFNPEMHTKLKLKIVDDVDAQFFVDNLERQERQYTSGFWEWLNRHSTSVLAVMIVCLVLVGFIVWLQKSPEMMAQCAGVAKQTIIEGLAEQSKQALLPPG